MTEPGGFTPDPEYIAWLEERECPLHGRTRVADAGDIPSMLGYGWEPWEVMECGCRLTLDPLRSGEQWRPGREP